MKPRVNYDRVAGHYDAQPHREKGIDPDLVSFLAQRTDREAGRLSILDIGCGTGNQLQADRAVAPAARLVGLDLSHSMLRQAWSKARDIGWVQANGAGLPFHDGAFDFVTSQFSFHHVTSKSLMIADVFRLLRSGGRFVMLNICPTEMRNWPIYRYFPAALQRDLGDFMPREEIKERMLGSGFSNVTVKLDHQEQEQDLRDIARTVRQRDTCSQLIAISDADYQAGLECIDARLRGSPGEAIRIFTDLCLVKIVGRKS